MLGVSAQEVVTHTSLVWLAGMRRQRRNKVVKLCGSIIMLLAILASLLAASRLLPTAPTSIFPVALSQDPPLEEATGLVAATVCFDSAKTFGPLRSLQSMAGDWAASLPSWVPGVLTTEVEDNQLLEPDWVQHMLLLPWSAAKAASEMVRCMTARKAPV